jgi:hypothetical protein
MSTPPSLSVLARADELYRQRAVPGAVEESVSILTAPNADRERFESQWRLARALFFLGQQARGRSEKVRLHSAAVQAGKQAVSLESTRVEGHFWLGVNLSLFAEARGGFKGAFAILSARRSLKRAARISESYHGAGPLRVLGRLDQRVPRLLGGDRRRGLLLFERALGITANSVTMIYAAELLVEMGERTRAAALLEEFLAIPPDADWEFESVRDRKIARDMLGKLRHG